MMLYTVTVTVLLYSGTYKLHRADEVLHSIRPSVCLSSAYAIPKIEIPQKLQIYWTLNARLQ